MKNMTLNENEIRTVIEVFGELSHQPYDEINRYLGTITIKEMLELKEKLNNWYHKDVLGNRYDEEFGWYDPEDIRF